MACQLSIASCFTALIAAILLQPAVTIPTLKITVIEADGFCTWDSSINQWVGFIPDIVKELGRVSQPPFSPQLVRVGDGRYGRFEEKTGRWSGLIGEVINGSADMAAAPLTQTPQRELHIDFTHEILDVGLVTIAKPQRQSAIRRSAAFFLSVFDAGVWLVAVVAFVSTSLLLFLNFRLNPREIRPELQQGLSVASALDDRHEFSLFGSVMFVVSTGCFQGYNTTPKSLAGRCLTITWWLFACIFATTYTASLVCGLVASRGTISNRAVTEDPRTAMASDILALDTLVPVWVPHGSTSRLMQNSTDPLFREFRRLNDRFVASGDDRLSKLKSIKDIVALLKTDAKFFGVMESDTALLEARRSSCELVVSPALLNDRSYAFAMPEKSNWTNVVNHAILLIRHSGFVSETYRRYFGSVSDTCGGVASGWNAAAAGDQLAGMFRSSLPITMATFSGPMLLFCFGLLLALLAAVADAFVFARFERYQRPSAVPAQSEDTHDATFGRLAFGDDREPVIGSGDT